jgi:hypothetical protein
MTHTAFVSIYIGLGPSTDVISGSVRDWQPNVGKIGVDYSAFPGVDQGLLLSSKGAESATGNTVIAEHNGSILPAEVRGDKVADFAALTPVSDLHWGHTSSFIL